MGMEEEFPLFLQKCSCTLYFYFTRQQRIGATIICRDDIPGKKELCFAIRKSKADTAFVMDYTSKEDEELFRATTPLTRMIKRFLHMIMQTKMQCGIYRERNCIKIFKEQKQEKEILHGKNSFELEKDYHEDYMAERNPDRPVFEHIVDLPEFQTGHPFSANVVAVAFQMSIFIPPSDVQKNGGFQFCHWH